MVSDACLLQIGEGINQRLNQGHNLCLREVHICVVSAFDDVCETFTPLFNPFRSLFLRTLELTVCHFE